MLTDKYHRFPPTAILPDRNDRRGRQFLNLHDSRRKRQPKGPPNSGSRFLFQAAVDLGQGRRFVERFIHCGCAPEDRRQLQSVADGLHALTFLLEKRSQREAR